MSFLFTTIWKWLQVAPRALEMFVGMETPQHNFHTAWEAACRAACKTAQDIGQEKSKQKLIFCRRAGRSGCSAVWRCSSPQGRLANTCSFQDFKMHFVTLLPANNAEIFQRTGISAYYDRASKSQSPPRSEWIWQHPVCAHLARGHRPTAVPYNHTKSTSSPVGHSTKAAGPATF